MPNGGITPCCWVCHWGSRNTGESSVACEQHQLITYLPLATFCADLALENDESKRRYFSDRKLRPEPDVMYEWLEITYKQYLRQLLRRYAEMVLTIQRLSRQFEAFGVPTTTFGLACE